MRVHACVYTGMHASVHADVCTPPCMHTRARLHVYTCVYVYMCAAVCAYAHTCALMYVYPCVPVCMCIHVCACVRVHAESQALQGTNAFCILPASIPEVTSVPNKSE